MLMPAALGAPPGAPGPSSTLHELLLSRAAPLAPVAASGGALRERRAPPFGGQRAVSDPAAPLSRRSGRLAAASGRRFLEPAATRGFLDVSRRPRLALKRTKPTTGDAAASADKKV